MPTVEVLRERREKARQREGRVENVIAADKVDLAKILSEIAEERNERDVFDKQRKKIADALEAEVKADKQGDGEHPGAWEARKAAKRDELADLIEGSEARLDRLVERAGDKQGGLNELAKRDSKLEARIDRITKRIKAKSTAAGLSPHFSVVEFGCRDGTPVPIASLPALKALCVVVLEPQRAKFGSVHVNSGYRTRSYNASIGGASDSVHIYDAHTGACAADHTCATGNAHAWFDNTAGKADGRGLYSSFHHADNRNRIGWPDAVWSG